VGHRLRTPEPSIAFSRLLRELRERAGLSIEELAERSRMSARQISKYETGHPILPRPTTLALLADALGLEKDRRADFIGAGRGLDPPVRRQEDAPHDRDGDPANESGLSRPFAVAWPPFIDRADQREELKRYLREGETAVLLLSGPPGIGASRLVEQTVANVIDGEYGSSVWVMSGTMSDPRARRPYDPIASIIQAHARRTSRIRLRAELRGCEEVAALMPVEVRDDVDVPFHIDRDRLCASIGRYLARIAPPSGIVLVLDNLHWAGDDALALLLALAQTSTGSPRRLRIVGLYDSRTSEWGDGFRPALDALRAQGLTREMPVHPLPREDAARLLEVCTSGAAVVDDDTRELACEKSGNVPLSLVEFGRALAVGMQARIPISGWTVERVIQERLFAVDDAHVDVLDMLAVFAWPAPLVIVATVCGQTEDDAAEALAALRDRGLLAERDGLYAFAHEIIRRTMLDNIHLERRRILHYACANTLLTLGDPSMIHLQAYHYIEYVRLTAVPSAWWDDKARVTIDEARTDASRTGAEAADGYYARALEARAQEFRDMMNAEMFGGVPLSEDDPDTGEHRGGDGTPP